MIQDPKRQFLALRGLLATTCLLVLFRGDPSCKALAHNHVEVRGQTLFVNGKPFSPFGLFCVAWTPEEIVSCLEDVKNHGFNTVHSYWAADVCRSRETAQAYLDEAEKRGLKVLPTIGALGREAALFQAGKREELEQFVRECVRPFKNHPALLAWYVWDEPNAEGYPASPECVRAVSEVVKREDPNHPTFFTFTPWHNLDKLKDYAACCDILCLDPYVFADYMGLVSKSLDLGARSAQGRPLWSLLWGCWNSGSRAPTVEETRCSSYLSLIHGATGLLYYGHLTEPGLRPPPEREASHSRERWQRGLADPLMRELYNGVSQLGREVRELAPALRSPLLAEDMVIEPSSPSLHCRVFKDKKGVVVLAANLGKEPLTARFRFKQRTMRGTVSELFRQRHLEMREGVFEDMFAPLATRAYRTSIRSR